MRPRRTNFYCWHSGAAWGEYTAELEYRCCPVSRRRLCLARDRTTARARLIYCDTDNNSAARVEYRHSICARRDSPSTSVRPVTDSHCRQETGRGNDVSITSTVRYIMPTRRRRSAIMRPLDRLVLASPLNDRPKLKIATAINHFDQFPTGVLVRSIARRRPRLMARRSGKASKSTRRVNVHQESDPRHHSCIQNVHESCELWNI